MTIKRFIVQQAIAGGVINAALNGPAGLLLLHGDATWPLWGLPSLSFDTGAMAFGIAWGTGLLLTPSLRKQIASGKVAVPELSAHWRGEFAKWPASAMHRGINLGGLALLAFALPAVLVMLACGVEAWGRGPVTLYKALFGLVVGAVVTPITALAVVAEPQPAAAGAAGAPQGDEERELG